MSVDPNSVVLRDLVPGDIGWLINRHAELYAENDGFDASFEILVASILVDFAKNRSTDMERGWIAVAGGKRLGSIFCVSSGEAGVAKLRLFLLEPEVRGLGLGQRLLEACILFARDTGNHTLRLWTHESHRAACALYARNGFVCTNSVPVTSFGQNLIEQTWELPLT